MLYSFPASSLHDHTEHFDGSRLKYTAYIHNNFSIYIYFNSFHLVVVLVNFLHSPVVEVNRQVRACSLMRDVNEFYQSLGASLAGLTSHDQGVLDMLQIYTME